MKVCKQLFLALLLFALAGAGCVATHAQGYGNHPAYLRALSDLRLMRGYLSPMTPNENVDAESQEAIAEIDAAIHEITEASISDGRDPHWHPPVDAHLTWTDRFHKAREAGNAAWADVNHEEDNDYAKGLKHRALDHIEKANHIIDHIIRRYEH